MFDTSFSHLMTTEPSESTLLVVMTKDMFAAWRTYAPARDTAWSEAVGFSARPGTICAIPGENGNPAYVLAGIVDDPMDRLWEWAAIFEQLPPGDYIAAKAAPETGTPLDPEEADRALLARLLSGYRFDQYKTSARHAKNRDARLVVPAAADRQAVERTARGIWMVRDLVNEPAGTLGPTALAAAARTIAERFSADCQIIAGDDLLAANYPAIHAVGRASTDAPRLIDMRWGNTRHPKVTLVGKGVCFDTGGLGIKSSTGMKLMKKDMGGAAHVLALGAMIMDADLPVRLRVLIPAVENAIAGNALRPMDVVPTRAGLTIEIGHTDAEGRVILSDALTEAVREDPAMLIDCATLTGAARVALGTDLPALFCNDDGLAADLLLASAQTGDPLWRMPLWQGYAQQVDGKVADLNNAPDSRYGGAITAALFLERFVNKSRSGTIPAWAHLDMMAWNLGSKPGRPEGGEAMGLRALYACIRERFGTNADINADIIV